jgi:hypothetical protein
LLWNVRAGVGYERIEVSAEIVIGGEDPLVGITVFTHDRRK